MGRLEASPCPQPTIPAVPGASGAAVASVASRDRLGNNLDTDEADGGRPPPPNLALLASILSGYILQPSSPFSSSDLQD